MESTKKNITVTKSNSLEGASHLLGKEEKNNLLAEQKIKLDTIYDLVSTHVFSID